MGKKAKNLNAMVQVGSPVKVSVMGISSDMKKSVAHTSKDMC